MSWIERHRLQSGSRNRVETTKTQTVTNPIFSNRDQQLVVVVEDRGRNAERQMEEGDRGPRAGRGLEAFLVRFSTMRHQGIPVHCVSHNIAAPHPMAYLSLLRFIKARRTPV